MQGISHVRTIILTALRYHFSCYKGIPVLFLEHFCSVSGRIWGHIGETKTPVSRDTCMWIFSYVNIHLQCWDPTYLFTFFSYKGYKHFLCSKAYTGEATRYMLKSRYSRHGRSSW